MMFSFFFVENSISSQEPTNPGSILHQFCLSTTAVHLKPEQSPSRTSPTPQLLTPEGIKPETLKGVYQAYTTRPTPTKFKWVGLWGSPGSGHASRLKECLQRHLHITHQRDFHIDSGS
ncbi:hypothetical protein MTR_3g108210 [Medicago truncatula]|uniref:Uncharacterized protein n=1 Tax=Medicago truncatula TaxID=3880 RepID=G7JBS2_MEDTR|nr:hypothetical protein MTR_3g108210 [Medicago truncatula]